MKATRDKEALQASGPGESDNRGGDADISELAEKECKIRRALDPTGDYFLRAQYSEGYWWSEL